MVAALGHTDATFEEMRAGAKAGATHVAHTFNGMRGLHHRDAGALGGALTLDELTCELIPDRIHVDPIPARVLHRCKTTSGVVLVTDAVAAAGMPDGSYVLGDDRVDVSEGRAVLPATDTLAGSTLTMDVGAGNAAEMLSLDMSDVARMTSGNAARAIGMSRETGAVAPGLAADLVVLEDDFSVSATMVGGRWVYDRDEEIGVT
jgi:N-acetylglucosamine-6-phosphate deacetylase